MKGRRGIKIRKGQKVNPSRNTKQHLIGRGKHYTPQGKRLDKTSFNRRNRNTLWEGNPKNPNYKKNLSIKKNRLGAYGEIIRDYENNGKYNDIHIKNRFLSREGCSGQCIGQKDGKLISLPCCGDCTCNCYGLRSRLTSTCGGDKQ